MGHLIDFGTINGDKAQLAVLKSGKFVSAISSFGSTIVWFGTKDRNYVTYHKCAEDYLDDSTYMGKTVGPYANRIKNAEFEIDGKVYKLEKNDGENSLHSGSACFGNKLWSIEGVSDNMVTLSLMAKETGGFPGDHEVQVTYLLTEDGVLTIFYRCTSNKKCPISITNHAYFVLDDRGDKYVELEIPSKKYVSVDSSLIPLKENPVKVEGSDFDFREKRAIGGRRDGCYDNTWVLDKNTVVKAEGNLAQLFVRTTEPGIQVYTGEFLSGKDAKPFDGLALETGRFPDSPNRPDFPREYTDKDRIYESTTSYKLVIKE